MDPNIKMNIWNYKKISINNWLCLLLVQKKQQYKQKPWRTKEHGFVTDIGRSYTLKPRAFGDNGWPDLLTCACNMCKRCSRVISGLSFTMSRSLVWAVVWLPISPVFLTWQLKWSLSPFASWLSLRSHTDWRLRLGQVYSLQSWVQSGSANPDKGFDIWSSTWKWGKLDPNSMNYPA